MAKKVKPDAEMVQIPKEEYDLLMRTNQENSEMITQLADDLDKVRTAQLAGAGIDPIISARALLPRKTVQFNQHYSRCAVPSKIQKGAIVIDAFSVACGDIVHIKEDEFKRINEDFPGKMEANPNKFKDKMRFKPEQQMDKTTGRMKIVRVKDPQPVELLHELAYKVG